LVNCENGKNWSGIKILGIGQPVGRQRKFGRSVAADILCDCPPHSLPDRHSCHPHCSAPLCTLGLAPQDRWLLLCKSCCSRVGAHEPGRIWLAAPRFPKAERQGRLGNLGPEHEPWAQHHHPSATCTDPLPMVQSRSVPGGNKVTFSLLFRPDNLPNLPETAP
jgi:hypothetical protein